MLSLLKQCGLYIFQLSIQNIVFSIFWLQFLEKSFFLWFSARKMTVLHNNHTTVTKTVLYQKHRHWPLMKMNYKHPFVVLKASSLLDLKSCDRSYLLWWCFYSILKRCVSLNLVTSGIISTFIRHTIISNFFSSWKRYYWQ